MRDYGKLAPTFWTRGPGRIFRGDHLAVAIAVYVHTCPASNMIGLYYLPLPTLCHEIGATPEQVRATFDRLEAADVAHYDTNADLIYVPDGAAEQAGPTMKAADNKHKAVIRELATFGSHRFVTAFWRRYGAAYQLGPPPSEAPSQGATQAPAVAPSLAPSGSEPEPLRSQKQKQDQLQDQNQGQDHARLLARTEEPPPSEPIVLPRAYALAYARGLTIGTGNPQSPPSGSTDMDRLVSAIDTHARSATGERISLVDTIAVTAWVAAEAETFGRTADAFARRCGFAVHAFVAWLNSRGSLAPGVQPAAKGGPSWSSRNPNVVDVAAGAAGAKGPA